MSDPLLRKLLPSSPNCNNDELLGKFLEMVEQRGLELYTAQEEAVLELYEGKHVILNTPTGSGKSMVATALHFRSMARGHRSVYTSPIKALVNEKFVALCRDFGAENVGLATGDATVNRDAPILCCTAEILANYALSMGSEAPFAEVIMDEFHYYSDPDRGVSWQVPLLTMSKSQFLLMSATMGSTDFFARELEKLTGVDAVVISSGDRPVPLEFTFSSESVDVTLQKLVQDDKAPVYLVHFTQNEAAQAAQDLMSINFCSTAEKSAIKEQLVGVKFNSPYGKEIKRFLSHGVGIHHAGLLPKYRILVERLAQKGMLKVICGTDTLGVGVNVPIRTVLFTRLSKFDGKKVSVLNARDFHQIAGRAGRKGFDDVGYVVAQAPEYVIENAKMEAKAAGDAKKLRKMVKKKPPEGFVGWNEETYKKLQKASPEPLISRFQVSHGMLLEVLSRDGDGCVAMRQLIARSHETEAAKKKHRDRAWGLFRALVDRKIVEFLPKEERQPGGRKLRLNVELQEDFSLNHALSLYLIDTLKLLDPQSPTYAADMLTLCESIVENPELLLRRQLAKVKNEAMARMKEEGVPYEERIERLEELEYPKPCRNFIYQTFNEFAANHPWVGRENIRPKSIAREMYENFRSFADYVNDYDLHRSEGLLLRHLSGVYKVLTQTVPDQFKTEEVWEMESWLDAVLAGTDSSLLDEWERLKNPDWQPKPDLEKDEEEKDITKDKRGFTALVRTEIFKFMKALVNRQTASALQMLESAMDEEGLNAALHDYLADHKRISLDNEARNGRHTYVEVSDDKQKWRVSQVLVDPDGYNDWQLIFEVDLKVAREQGRPVLRLQSMEPVHA